MTTLPLELALRTVTTKVTPAAWDRAQALKEATGARLSDVVSACLLYMDGTEIERLLAEQQKALDALPKSVRGLLRNIDRMTDAEREMLREALTGSSRK